MCVYTHICMCTHIYICIYIYLYTVADELSRDSHTKPTFCLKNDVPLPYLRMQFDGSYKSNNSGCGYARWHHSQALASNSDE